VVGHRRTIEARERVEIDGLVVQRRVRGAVPEVILPALDGEFV
jgi:hypothetical protein